MTSSGAVVVIEAAAALFGGVKGSPTVFAYDLPGRLVVANPPYADAPLSSCEVEQ